MQSLIGKLIYFTRAILPGRAFVRRLYDATIGAKPHNHIRITKVMHEDLSCGTHFYRIPMDKFIFWIVHGHWTLYCSYLRTVQFCTFVDKQVVWLVGSSILRHKQKL